MILCFIFNLFTLILTVFSFSLFLKVELLKIITPKKRIAKCAKVLLTPTQQAPEVAKVAPNLSPLIHPMCWTTHRRRTALKIARPINTLFIPTKHAKTAATDTNATVKLKFYANRAPIAHSQFKRSVQQGHMVSNKAKQQTQRVLYAPKVLINQVTHLSIALIGKLFLCRG